MSVKWLTAMNRNDLDVEKTAQNDETVDMKSCSLILKFKPNQYIGDPYDKNGLNPGCDSMAPPTTCPTYPQSVSSAVSSVTTVVFWPYPTWDTRWTLYWDRLADKIL